MSLHKDVTERSKNIQALHTELKAKLAKAKDEQEASAKGLADFKNKCSENLKRLNIEFNEL